MTHFKPNQWPFKTPTTYDPGIIWVDQELDKKSGEIVTSGRIEYTKGEVNDEPSMTTPDMALSVKEILYRYASNRPVNINNNLVYTGDEHFPNPKALDKMDMMDMARENEAAIDQLQKNLQEVENKKKQRENQRKINDEVKKRMADKGGAQNDEGGTTKEA